MRVSLLVEPTSAEPAPVEFRWDADTDILTAQLLGATTGSGMTGSVEVEGADGSWIMLEVRGGQLSGIEIAVWPDVANVGTLSPPANVTDARVTFPSRVSQPGVAAVEVETRVSAEADAAEQTIRFRLSGARPAAVLRVARDILIEVDESNQLAGLWFLNVPPFPAG